jgi:hypothetical protein
MQQEDGFYPYGGEDDEEMYYGNYTVNGGNKPFQTREKERETEKGTEKGKEDEFTKEFERVCEDLFYNGNIENKEMRIQLSQIFPFLSLPPEDKLANIGIGKARPTASGLGPTTVRSGNRVLGIVPTKSGKVRMLNTSKNMSKNHHNGGLGNNLSEFIEEVLYRVPHLERKKMRETENNHGCHHLNHLLLIRILIFPFPFLLFRILPPYGKQMARVRVLQDPRLVNMATATLPPSGMEGATPRGRT